LREKTSDGPVSPCDGAALVAIEPDEIGQGAPHLPAVSKICPLDARFSKPKCL
jgi:hypothetical protein